MRLGVLLLWIAAVAWPAGAQVPSAPRRTPVPKTTATGPPVRFFVPDTYMTVDFPEQQGHLLLNPERPAGMFILYPNNRTDLDDLARNVRKVVSDMYPKVVAEPGPWSTSSVPPFPTRPNERGELSVSVGREATVQLLIVRWPQEGSTVVYGYFALRHTARSSGAVDGEFLDGNGSGVEDFDAFRRSIRRAGESSGDLA